MRFDTLGMPTGEDCPLPGELALVECWADDEDGDATTLVVTLEALPPAAFTTAYPTRVSTSSPTTTQLDQTTHAIVARFVLRTSGYVRGTCEVTDSHGRRDVRVRVCSGG